MNNYATGCDTRTIDKARRVAIPIDWTHRFGKERVCIVPWFDHSLAVFPLEEFNKISEALVRRAWGEEGRLACLRIFSMCAEDSLDKQGRITVTQELLRYVHTDDGPHANLWEDLVLVGHFDRVVIYSQKKYEELMQRACSKAIDGVVENMLEEVLLAPRSECQTEKGGNHGSGNMEQAPGGKPAH